MSTQQQRQEWRDDADELAKRAPMTPFVGLAIDCSAAIVALLADVDALQAERDALAQQLQQAQAQLAAVPVDAMRLLLWGDATQPGYANAVGTVGDWLIAEQDAANAAAELRAPTYNGGCW